MTALKVYGFFLKIVFLNLFSKTSSRTIALHTLFNSHSYRIPHNLNKYKAPFVYWLKSIKIIFSKAKTSVSLNPNVKAMYCLNEKHAALCMSYSKQIHMDLSTINVFIRDVPNSYHLNIIDKSIVLVCNSFLAFYSLLASIFGNKTRKLSILATELAETTLLLSYVLKCKTNYLFYFSAFEKDANFVALLMQKHNVYCHKIPSSNPIKNFYAKVIADRFSFTAPFQINEYPSLKSDWIVKDFDMMPNFGFQNLLDKTVETNGPAPVNSIGIFTRGIWLRKLRGDNFLGVGEDAAEFAMLDSIKYFLSNNSNIQTVYILLHPTEKNTEDQYLATKKYYTDFFSGINIQFTDPKLPSYNLFNLFDVGVASLSSVIFERLYCGYKCLLSPIHLKVKLYEDSNLENIIVNSENEFSKKLNEILMLSNEAYFLNYNLKDYRLSTIKNIEI